MSTLETPKALETINEVAAVLRAGIEETKALLVQRIRRGAEEEESHGKLQTNWPNSGRYSDRWRSSITMNVGFKDKDGRPNGSTLEKVPHGYDKGMTDRLDRALENIQVQGMTSEAAIEAALTQICGERREPTEEDVDANSFVVNLQFVTIAGSDEGILPTLMLGKIERANDTLETAAGVYKTMLEEEAYLSGEGANLGSSDRGVEKRRELLTERKEQIENGLGEVRAMQAYDAKPPFAVWRGGLTGMSVSSQIHGVYGIAKPVHMIRLPRAEKSLAKEAANVDASLKEVGANVSDTVK